jgi:hypothetical protein
VPGKPLEARTHYHIEPGEYLLELVVRRFHFFESPKAGYASCRFRVKSREIQYVSCQYNGEWGLSLIPGEDVEFNILRMISRKLNK